MTLINFENQSTLARLLAKENITVTTGNMSTAYFDVKNRTLGLPAWKNRGKDVYDMLTGHEVGHALYTPQDSVERLKERCGSIPFDVCNIVEDIRIERLIQKTYPGLPRVFRSAYKTLTEDDFFGIRGKDVDSLKFLDRLNLRGKIGNLAEIPLNDDEETIYKKCLEAESFDDVLEICAEIKEFLENNPEPKHKTEETEEGGNAVNDDMPSAPDTESSDNDGEDEESDDGSESHSEATDETDEEPEVETSSADIKSEDDAETSNEDEGETAGSGEPEIPEELLEDMLSDTMKDFDKSLEDEVETPKEQGYTPLLAPRKEYIYDTIIDYKTLSAERNKRREELGVTGLKAEVLEKLNDFKKTTNKKVGTLVREFEQRKAAYQYSRATTARTGKLDVNKLHGYKMTDELFLSQTKLADAKSHGMIFLIDYSGSMSGVIGDVIAQTLNLVTFCKKVGIPFVVYSFTSRYHADNHKSKMTATINEVDLSDTLLVEQISSDLSKSDYEEAFRDLWLRVNSYVTLSNYDSLGGTPLDNVLTTMPTIINDFIRKHKVQKVNFVTLTDGDSHSLQTNHGYGDYHSKMHIKLAGKYHQIHRRATQSLMEIIQGMPGVTTIGFYLPNSTNHIKYTIERTVGWRGQDHRAKVNKLRKEHKKAGFLNLENAGFDAYYLLDSNVKIDDSDFTYETGGVDIATTKRAQTALAKEFGKHHSAARKTRVLLTSIASQIA